MTETVLTGDFRPKMIVFTGKSGEQFWLDIVEGKFDFGGNIDPTEAADIFLTEIGKILMNRMLEQTDKFRKEE